MTDEHQLMEVLPGTSQSCKINNSDLKRVYGLNETDGTDVISLPSVESFVCRICHNNENPERLISPCLCKGSLTYVHCYCLERWIAISSCTMCELCHFQYNIEQTLRYNFYQSLRIWYSRPMSRRALQEDCQMFLLLSLIAFGIVGTLLVAVQFYILQGQVNGLGRLWTKGWLIFFLLTTLVVYVINAYLVIKAQLLPWYRWWQAARDVRIILENHKPTLAPARETKSNKNSKSVIEASDESACQTAETNCPPQDIEAAQRNYESQPKRQRRVEEEIEAACNNVQKSSKIVSCRNETQMLYYFMRKVLGSKLRWYLFANSGGAARNEAEMSLEPPNNCLAVTV